MMEVVVRRPILVEAEGSRRVADRDMMCSVLLFQTPGEFDTVLVAVVNLGIVLRDKEEQASR